MAEIDLWIDPADLQHDSIGFKTEIQLDFERFHYDRGYAHLVSEHIQRGLEYMAKEVGELDLAIRRGDLVY